MSIKNKKRTRDQRNDRSSISLSVIDSLLTEPEQKGITGYVKKHRVKGAVCVFVLLLGLGVFAKNGWLPRTDPLSGKKTGWFGSDLPKNATTAWIPFAMAFATPTPPQLSKEYVYAGSRLLTVEDAKANAVPPADLAVFRPSTGEWRIYRGETELEPVTWGQEGDVPIQGDYDGDGKTDFAIFRPSDGQTHILRSSDNTDYTVDLGGANDIPVPSDRDGDGKTDVVLWDSATHEWTAHLSATAMLDDPEEFGSNDDKPVAGDFDGDGKSDHAYFRSSNHTFYSINSSDGQPHSVPSFNSLDGIPVCGDYDGDGKSDFALLSGNIWTIHYSSTDHKDTITWQNAGDIPVPNDYDADGKVDIAVWRSGMWYISQSSDLETRTEKFGEEGDIPVPANYRR